MRLSSFVEAGSLALEMVQLATSSLSPAKRWNTFFIINLIHGICNKYQIWRRKGNIRSISEKFNYCSISPSPVLYKEINGISNFEIYLFRYKKRRVQTMKYLCNIQLRWYMKQCHHIRYKPKPSKWNIQSVSYYKYIWYKVAFYAGSMSSMVVILKDTRRKSLFSWRNYLTC